jgi:hypothetical protein
METITIFTYNLNTGRPNLTGGLNIKNWTWENYLQRFTMQKFYFNTVLLTSEPAEFGIHRNPNPLNLISALYQLS